MKRVLSGILILLLGACSAIQPAAPSGPTSPPLTQTSSPLPVVSNTTTVDVTATSTSIPITETPAPPTWTPLPTATERINARLKPGKGLMLTSIQMFDAQNGWAFDSDHHILRTINGGLYWLDVTPPTGYYTDEGFFALDANTAWAAFSVGLYQKPATTQVWRTQDGGITWQPSETFRLNIDENGEPYESTFYLPKGMQFIDSQTGWLLAEVSYNMNSTRPLFFQTRDGGRTWTTINSRIGLPDSCVSVGFVFLDAQKGWEGGNCFAQGVLATPIRSIVNDGGWSIGKTLDGGHTYEQKTLMPLPAELQQPALSNTEANCGEVRFIHIAQDTVGIEWGCIIFGQRIPDYRYFALSADAGQTWKSWSSTGNESFLDATLGWRLLSPGQLQQTVDGGANWVTIKTVTWQDAEFDFINDKEGWAIASSKQGTSLLHSIDGGKIWSKINPIVTK